MRRDPSKHNWHFIKRSAHKTLRVRSSRSTFRETILCVDRFFAPLVLLLKESNIARICAIALGVFTAFQLSIDLIDRRDERKERQDAAIERAWSRLLTPLGGNSGKGAVLNVLINSGESVAGADLSCQRVGEWSEEQKICKNIVVFSGVRWIKSESALPNFSQANIYKSNFDAEEFDGKEFHGTIFQESSMKRSNLRRYEDPVQVFRSDITDSLISPTQLQTTTQSNISGVKIVPRTKDGRFQIDSTDKMPNWIWADNPPVVVRSKLRPINGKSVVNAQEETIEEPWQGDYVICDPRVSVFKPSRFLGRELSDGRYYLEMLEGYCKTMSFDEANTAWPEAYRSKASYKSVAKMIFDGDF